MKKRKMNYTNSTPKIQEPFFALIRSMVCENHSGDEWTHPGEEELKQILSLAKAHDLMSIITAALAKQNLLPPAKAAQHQLNAVWRYEKLNHELDQICRVLEQNGIDYIPLKGAVIRPYYPEPWLRTSCDIDILVHEEDLDRMSDLLMSELNYTLDEEKSVHHISMHAPNGVHLEPHFNLRENTEKLDKVLDEVWENSRSTGGHRYTQSNEFLLFHIIAHMSHHFQNGGCGVKPFIDLYLLEQKLDFDKDRLMDFCKRAGVAQFYDCARKVIDVWFNESPHTDVTRRIEDFVLSGGVYGTKANHVAIAQERAGNKFRHILTRIFMPMKSLKIKYPILEKHPWLMPVYQAVRWVQMLCKKQLGTYRRELDMICGLSDERRNEIGRLLDDVGL